MGGVCSRDGAEESKKNKKGLSNYTYTAVPPELFDHPVPVSMNGGTAAFFKCKYIGPKSGPDQAKYDKSDSYWLGKDVARALDELPFYEGIQYLDPHGYSLLTDWTMIYGGVLNKEVVLPKNGKNTYEERDLLVIHDIADGLSVKRMLDIKLGEETAVGGYQGKSNFAAWRQRHTVDSFTNSNVQGFRLEGFDNPPSCLESQDYGGQGACISLCSAGLTKKYKRLSFQRMKAREFLRYFIDTNDLAVYEKPNLLSAIEYSEAILFDSARQLAQMCADALKVPVPQMWIGSSLCLACDGRRLPDRRSAIQRLATKRLKGPAMQPEDIAKVCVFDWGRSELNTPQLEAEEIAKGEDKRGERKEFWEKWQRPLFRCLFESVNLYLAQFFVRSANDRSNAIITVSAWDYDTFDANDYLGSATLPLQETEEETEVQLYDLWGTEVGWVHLTVTREQPAQGSRLQEVWKVTVHRVDGLPKADIFSDTDPLVRVEIGPERDESAASYEDSWQLIGMRSAAQTKVVYDDRNAEIDDTLTFGIVDSRYADQLIEWINSALNSQLALRDFVTLADSSTAECRSDRQMTYEDFLGKIGDGSLRRAVDRVLADEDEGGD